MRQRIQQGFVVIVSLWLLCACTTSDVVPILPSDDFGPRPDNYPRIAAAWFNAHYRYTPPNPIQPDELSLTEPVKVAAADRMLGRLVGWQVILGPENKVVTNFTDLNYTRLIINRGRVISVTSSDQPFLTVPK